MRSNAILHASGGSVGALVALRLTTIAMPGIALSLLLVVLAVLVSVGFDVARGAFGSQTATEPVAAEVAPAPPSESLAVGGVLVWDRIDTADEPQCPACGEYEIRQRMETTEFMCTACGNGWDGQGQHVVHIRPENRTHLRKLAE